MTGFVKERAVRVIATTAHAWRVPAHAPRSRAVLPRLRLALPCVRGFFFAI